MMSNTKQPTANSDDTQKRKHGGKRTILCWQDKLTLIEDDTIADFISVATCGGKCECFTKIRQMARSEAAEIIKSLREARMKGENLCDASQTSTTAWTTVFLLVGASQLTPGV